MLKASIVEMSLQGLDPLVSPLRFHRWRVFAVARTLTAPRDMSQGDLGVLAAAGPF